jgi:hypothetical protein
MIRALAHDNITPRPIPPCSFGFVQFESHDSAAAAKEALAGTMIDNRRCDVCSYFSPMNFVNMLAILHCCCTFGQELLMCANFS